MNMPITYDTARLTLMLNDLRLPTIGRLWPEFAQRADKEGWQATRLLGALLEHELAERAKRRIERQRTESRLDPTKTLASFDFNAVPMVSKAHVMALAIGDSWLDKGANVLIFGPPGGGKSHLGSAIGHALIDAGYRVLFTRTSELVQKLQAARQSLQLPAALTKIHHNTDPTFRGLPLTAEQNSEIRHYLNRTTRWPPQSARPRSSIRTWSQSRHLRNYMPRSKPRA